MVQGGDDIDGVPFLDPALDGLPMTEDIDGVPSESVARTLVLLTVSLTM